MVFDRLERFLAYCSLHRHFRGIHPLLTRTDLVALPGGKFEMRADGLYAILDRYTTAGVEASFIESHRKYIDVQLMLRGEEQIGVCAIEEGVQGPYDEQHDFLKIEKSPELTWLLMKPGTFAIFWPSDGHMTKLAGAAGPGPVVKLIVKVPL